MLKNKKPETNSDSFEIKAPAPRINKKSENKAPLEIKVPKPAIDIYDCTESQFDHFFAVKKKKPS